MTYRTHLRAALDAFFKAAPDVSQRRLSREAGLGAGWVSEFLRCGQGNLEKADALLGAMARLAPDSPAGARVRRMIGQLRPLDDPAAARRGAA